MPKATGKSTWNASLTTESAKSNPISPLPAPLPPNTNPIHKGVKKTPNKLEMDALKIAEGIFPRAMETITTDEDTVEGRVARKKVPVHNNESQLPPEINLTNNISRGKTIKVTD